MSTGCTRCEGMGFLNLDQIEDPIDLSSEDAILKLINENNDHDVQVCDCCGDGENWYGYPGEHYNNEDPPGQDGPYLYNGGYCECH